MDREGESKERQTGWRRHTGPWPGTGRTTAGRPDVEMRWGGGGTRMAHPGQGRGMVGEEVQGRQTGRKVLTSTDFITAKWESNTCISKNTISRTVTPQLSPHPTSFSLPTTVSAFSRARQRVLHSFTSPKSRPHNLRTQKQAMWDLA